MTTPGMQGEVSPESMGKMHHQPSEARPARNPPLPQLLGNTAEQSRLKPCTGKPFELSNELEYESQKGNPGLLLVTTTVYEWTWGGLALRADRLDPVTAPALLDVGIFDGPVATGTTTTMMAPVTLLAVQRRVGLPWWLGVWGHVALVEQTVETVTIFGSRGFTQPGGAMNWQLGGTLTLGWLPAFAFWGWLRGPQHVLVA
jgi:hypothetical protein